MDFIYSSHIQKIVCKGEYLYVAEGDEIVKISLLRKFKNKDIIKEKFKIIPTKTIDELTSIFNDCIKGDTKFIHFAKNDNHIQTVHSSIIQKRIITLNNERTKLKIKDFYIFGKGFMILMNNGSLIQLIDKNQICELNINEQVNSLCVEEDDYAYNTGQQLIFRLDNKKGSFALDTVYKDFITIKAHNLAIFNTQGQIVIIFRNGYKKVILIQALHIQLVDDTKMLILDKLDLIQYHIETDAQKHILELKAPSKFICLCQKLILNNGQILEHPTDITCFQSIDSACQTTNSLALICAGKTNYKQKQSIYIIKNQYPTEYVFELVINSLNQGTFDNSDLLYYYQRSNQINSLIEVALLHYDEKQRNKKKQMNDFNSDPITQKYAGVILFHLLKFKEREDEAQDIHNSLYIEFLKSRPFSDRIIERINMLDNQIQKKTQISLFKDKCPFCNDILVQWDCCQKHKFIRCQVSQIPIIEQPIIQCKFCKFFCMKEIFNQDQCPICYSQMKALI